VRVDARLVDGRVPLRYEMAPLHPVTDINFAGNLGVPGIDAGALRRAIVDRFGATPPAGRLAEIERIVADALADRGYLHPSITPAIQTFHAPEHAVLTLAIVPGV